MDRECHYALVSQQLDNFTPKFQRQLLETGPDLLRYL